MPQAEAIDAYDDIKHVANVCPRCGARAMYRLKYKYPDEGHRLCSNCQSQDRVEEREKSEYEERLTQLADDINELKARGLI